MLQALVALLSEWWAFEARLAGKVAAVFRALKGPSIGWCNSGKVPTSTLRDLICHGPKSQNMSCGLLHSSHTTSAITASLLADVPTVCGQPTSTSATGIMLHVSLKCCYSH
jgi:hypothetical protein